MTFPRRFPTVGGLAAAPRTRPSWPPGPGSATTPAPATFSPAREAVAALGGFPGVAACAPCRASATTRRRRWARSPLACRRSRSTAMSSGWSAAFSPSRRPCPPAGARASVRLSSCGGSHRGARAIGYRAGPIRLGRHGLHPDPACLWGLSVGGGMRRSSAGHRRDLAAQGGEGAATGALMARFSI